MSHFETALVRIRKSEQRDSKGRWTSASSIDDLRSHLDELGVDHALYEHDADISLNKIVVPADKREAGIGTAAMHAITTYADAKGLAIGTTPDGAYGGKVSRLKQFYESHGFKPNKGKARDFSISESYVRPATTINKAFDPHQPRGKGGKWITNGSSGPNEIHTFINGGTAPKSLNGVKIKSWSKAPTDKTSDGWAAIPDVEGADPHPLKTVSQNDGQTGEMVPKIAASGVIIQEPDGRVWLTKPANSSGVYKHTWPKGGSEPNLTLQQNAVKGAYKETGLHVQITGHAGDYEHDTTVSRYYHAKRVGGDPRDAGSGSEAVVLAPPHALHSLLNKDVDQKIAHEHAGAPPPPEKAPTTLFHTGNTSESDSWWKSLGFKSGDVKKAVSFNEAIKARSFNDVMKSHKLLNQCGKDGQ